MTRQEYESSRHLQKWLSSISRVIYEAFPLVRWLKRSGIIAALRNIQLEVQRFRNVLGQISLLRMWMALLQQDAGLGVPVAQTRGNALSPLHYLLSLIPHRGNPAVLAPRDDQGNYAHGSSIPRGLLGEMIPRKPVGFPELTIVLARRSQGAKGNKGNILPSVSSHHSYSRGEKRLPLGSEDSLWNEIDKARHLVVDLKTIFGGALSLLVSLQNSDETTMAREASSPSYLPDKSVSSVVGEYLRRSIRQGFESASIASNLTSLGGGNVWPRHKLVGVEPRRGAFLAPQGEESRLTDTAPAYRVSDGPLDRQTDETANPDAFNYIARLFGGIHRQVGTNEASARLYSALRLWTGAFTSSGEKLLPLSFYPGREVLYPEQLLGLRDLLSRLQEAVFWLTREIKEISRRNEGQGNREVEKIFNIITRAGEMEETDMNVLNRKLGRFLAREARRYGVSV